MKVLLAAAMVLASAASAPAQGPGARNKYDEIFRKYSKQYFGVGFDWRIFKAQGMTESNLRPDARSWVGAMGIMQLMPSTFKEVQTRNPELKDINDPRWNIAGGIYYNRRLWNAWSDHEQFRDRLRFMFGAYNAGRGTILKAKSTAEQDRLDPKYWESVESVAPKVPRWRYEETLNYVRRIRSNYSALAAPGKTNRGTGYTNTQFMDPAR
jgi:membrane-bound lytic murein transglycosylase F